MPRQRRAVGTSDNKNNKEKSTNSSSSNGSNTSNKPENNSSSFFHWKQLIVCFVLCVSICFGYLGYLETRVNTPFDDHKVVVKSGLAVPDKLWGTYRPGVYFGFKTREPQSLVTGLMWYFPRRLKPGGEGFRHLCEQGDHLETYGWIKHDGINFGVQEIADGPYIITTSFVKTPGGDHGGDWTARISVDFSPKYDNAPNEEVSLIWYTALDEDTKGHISSTNYGTRVTGVRGETTGLGKFKIKIITETGTPIHESFLSTVTPGLNLLRETVVSALRLVQVKPNVKMIALGGVIDPPATNGKYKPNLIATQMTGKVPFAIDVAFESDSFFSRHETLVGEAFTKSLGWHQARFAQRFENTFHLQEKGYNKHEVRFAQSALSNMIGGIGYFYGASLVQSLYTKEPVLYWKAPLYTGVPSRSFFPRGFLWDEGFHGLLIAQWDLDMELDIISHWFDLMNVEGWIPREQILGAEALARVPEEFVVQRNTNANPPTFFLTLQYILRKYRNEFNYKERYELLERLYPRLQAWFSWFNTTQRGELPGSYRWRGRDAHTNRELNPKTLTSGLDDYPRASHPTDDERHIDLYCWIAIAADTLAKIAKILDRDGFKYEQTAKYLKDNNLMNQLHWSDFAQVYADYGLHTDSVMLQRPQPLPRSENQNMEMVRITYKNPEYRLVDSTFGYVSLFPFLLQIIEPDSHKLGKILTDLRNPDTIWTDFGLRSLSKNSPLYMYRNTEHDPPYWRGQIWININFLAVRALNHYANVDGPFRNQALKIYGELRQNLISNLVNQYYKSGYLWEQYNDKTGEGSGCRPFTGWSALVVALMSENY